MNWLRLFLSLFVISVTAAAQQAPSPLTNDDVQSMISAGLAEQTIVLSIQRGPTKFDTSPQSLISLKKAGATDAVLNAMLASSREVTKEAALPASGAPDPAKLIDAVLAAAGPQEKLRSINSTRVLYTLTQTRSGTSATYDCERVYIFPDEIYLQRKDQAGATYTIVVGPQIAYSIRPEGRTQLSSAIADDYRTGMRFSIAYLAQHRSEFTFLDEGDDTVGTQRCRKVRVRHVSGRDQVWSIDDAGNILRVFGSSSTGAFTIEDSDFREFDGFRLAAHLHGVFGDSTNESTMKEFQANPPDYAINRGLFNPPANVAQSAQLTIKVIEEQSIPYLQKLGGGPATSCNITGGSHTTSFGQANTSLSANTIGNTTYENANTTLYGNSSTNTNLHLQCNSYDTTVNWRHVLNVMLVEGSDGVAYIIGCDAAWRWSKCVPLRAGDTFAAQHTSKGIAVQAVSAKGKQTAPEYSVLQSKTFR